ncbi:MAG TPA: hypothetical protein VFH36_08500 [Acidimicrobiales bacterium]|nr:hypothetical protein [Acidimicrobiales bacterium]
MRRPRLALPRRRRPRRADILHLATALAEEYGLAARVWLDDGRRKTREQGKPVVDNAFLDSYSIGLDDKAGTYDHEGVTVIDYRPLQQAWNA